MPGIGDRITINFNEEGFMDISFPQPEEKAPVPDSPDDISEDNPFLESDLPLSQLAEDQDTDL